MLNRRKVRLEDCELAGDAVGPSLSEDKSGPRVALVTDWCHPRQGGIETHLLALGERLRADGFDARIVTSFPGEDTIGCVPIDRLPGFRLPGVTLAASPRLVSIMEECFRRRGFDVIHIHSSIIAPVCLAGYIAARRLSLPIIVTFHSAMATMPTFLKLLDDVTGWTGKCAHVAGASSIVAGQINRAFGRDVATVLPNGFDSSLWSGKAKSARPHDRFHVVSAMRLQRRKRPSALIDIFDRASRKAEPSGIDMHMTIAGDGSLRPQLEADIRQRGLSDRINLVGWLAPRDLKALYSCATVFAMPSRREAFCIAALEARASALPVIAMRGNGIGDFITDGQNGILCNDDTTMADNLAALAADRERLERLRTTPGEIAQYDWSSMLDRHAGIYRAAFRSPPKDQADSL